MERIINFKINHEDREIVGVQYIPEHFEETKKYGAVIVSHGFICDYHSTETFCRYFASMGYVAYGFNFCEGLNMSITSEVGELMTVKDYVKGKAFIDPENIILVGYSQGGFVSGITAARCKDEIRKLIMIYPALCIPDDARRGKLGGGRYDVNAVPDEIDCGRTTIGKGYHEDVVHMDAYMELTGYKGPVLILHGLEDEIVDYSYSIRAQKMYEKDQCELQLIPHAGHGFNEIQDESALASISQFLQGRRKIFDIKILITDCEEEERGEKHINKVYFTGYCDNPLFKGTVGQGACDTQVYMNDRLVSARAEYTLLGLDSDNMKSYIHIINKREQGQWKPQLYTNSKVLSWINDKNYVAVLDHSPSGPVVKIFIEE